MSVSGQFNGQWSLPREFKLKNHKHPFQFRKKNININVWMRFSICKLQKHSRVGDADSSSLPLFTKWYFKFTILVDLYGPLKLVLIFSASTGPTTMYLYLYALSKAKIIVNGFPKL